MSNKHAQRTWNTSKDAVPTGHVQITVYEETTGKRIATVFEHESHAKLIAAAPQLLEACEKVLGILNHGTHNSHWEHIDRLRAAIKAASE